MAGQGTVGLEIAEDAARFGVTLDAVRRPVPAAAWSRGVALALKGAGVTAPVHSVEPENFDGMRRSLAAHARTRRRTGRKTLHRRRPDGADAGAPCLCAGGGIAGAGHRGQRRGTGTAPWPSPPLKLKLLVEPGGAAALAALLAGKLDGQESSRWCFRAAMPISPASPRPWRTPKTWALSFTPIFA